MSRNRLMVIAGVLLVLALILPIYVVIVDSTEMFSDLIHRGPSVNWDETDIQSFFQDVTARHIRLFTILLIGEVAIVVLFLITLGVIMRLR